MLSISTASSEPSEQRPWLRSWAPSSAARSLAEAEGRLEQELGAGFRVVVAFDHRGEAERARYNLKRLEARLLDGGALPGEGALAFAEAPLTEGFVAPDLKLALIPFRRLVRTGLAFEAIYFGCTGRSCRTKALSGLTAIPCVLLRRATLITPGSQ